MNKLRKLDGPIYEAKTKTKFLVFLLHGWGSNGDDLIQLSQYWSKFLPNATFIAPHGPEPCDSNPFGRQWFSINNQDTSELILGLKMAYQDVLYFIESQLKKYELEETKYFVVGFSQGSMLALHLSLRKECKGILGFSGAYIETQPPENQAKNDLLLVHGELDDVVPISRMYSAIASLKPLSKSLEFHTSKNLGHSIDDIGLQKGADFMSKKTSE